MSGKSKATTSEAETQVKLETATTGPAAASAPRVKNETAAAAAAALSTSPASSSDSDDDAEERQQQPAAKKQKQSSSSSSSAAASSAASASTAGFVIDTAGAPAALAASKSSNSSGKRKREDGQPVNAKKEPIASAAADDDSDDDSDSDSGSDDSDNGSDSDDSSSGGSSEDGDNSDDGDEEDDDDNDEKSDDDDDESRLQKRLSELSKLTPAQRKAIPKSHRLSRKNIRKLAKAQRAINCDARDIKLKRNREKRRAKRKYEKAVAVAKEKRLAEPLREDFKPASIHIKVVVEDVEHAKMLLKQSEPIVALSAEQTKELAEAASTVGLEVAVARARNAAEERYGHAAEEGQYKAEAAVAGAKDAAENRAMEARAALRHSRTAQSILDAQVFMAQETKANCGWELVPVLAKIRVDKRTPDLERIRAQTEQVARMAHELLGTPIKQRARNPDGSFVKPKIEDRNPENVSKKFIKNKLKAQHADMKRIRKLARRNEREKEQPSDGDVKPSPQQPAVKEDADMAPAVEEGQQEQQGQQQQQMKSTKKKKKNQKDQQRIRQEKIRIREAKAAALAAGDASAAAAASAPAAASTSGAKGKSNKKQSRPLLSNKERSRLARERNSSNKDSNNSASSQGSNKKRKRGGDNASASPKKEATHAQTTE